MHFVLIQIKYGDIYVGIKLEMVLNEGKLSTMCRNHFNHCMYTCI